MAPSKVDVEPRLEAYESSDSSKLFAQSDQFWDNYNKGRPPLPNAVLNRIFDYHKAKGGSFGVVHDVGAGNGPYAQRLRSRFDHVIVSDIIPKNIELARQRLHGQDGFSFRAKKLEDADGLSDESVDMIFATNVMHFAEPQEAAMEVLARQLRPGGTFAAAGFGPARFEDAELQDLWSRINYQGARRLLKGSDDTAPTIRMMARTQDQYNVAPLDENLFEAAAHRVHFNMTQGGIQDMLPPESAHKNTEPNHTGITDVDIHETEQGWQFEMGVQEIKDHFNSFPFISRYPEEFTDLYREIDEILSGGKTAKGYFPAKLILATRKRACSPSAATEGLQLNSKDAGLARLSAPLPQSEDVTAKLLLKNHLSWHMFFRDIGGHNHLPHAILTTFAMGGSPEQLARAYTDGVPCQRLLPPVDPEVVEEMKDPTKFKAYAQQLSQYSNFLAFFEDKIAEKNGDWRIVVTDTCFTRTPLADFMLAQLLEGVYHPIIHLGFGVEFNLRGLIAEGLAQAASHDPVHLEPYFLKCEKLVQTGSVRKSPLFELYHKIRENDTIRTAPRVPDGPWRVRDGVLGRAMDEMVAVAAQFQVEPTEEAVDRATAEVASCAAWSCAASCFKAGREPKMDFFMMHSVTSSIFSTVFARQPWISIENKARLLEWKARLDLVYYAAAAAPALHDENFLQYKPTLSSGMDWHKLYEVINEHHDDGHVAKFVRAVKNGEDITRPFEKDVEFAKTLPVKGENWLTIAQMCYDFTANYVEAEKKWVWGVGFDLMWNKVPAFVTAK